MNKAKKAILLSILSSTLVVTGCQSVPMGQQSDVA